MSDSSQEKMLSLYPLDYPFETLVSRINSKPAKLKLDPDFQRKYKWDKDGWGRSSKFIESCLMRIPLPSCYFAEDEDGTHMVIDGLQRLTTINRFFKNEFALEGLTTFKELEGKKFSELGSYQTDLETTTIRCIVLRKDNPKSLIREIFSRLNQGAVELSDQEIRHAIYPGELDQLLAELGADDEIKRFGLADNSNSVRDGLEPEEQVLRYFAFSDDKALSNFDNNLKSFLDNYMEKNSSLDAHEFIEHRERFLKALSTCKEIFGDDVFVNPSVDRKRKGLVHYDLMMTTVGELDPEIARKYAAEIKNAYSTLCQSDEFKRTLSGGLQNKGSIQRRRAQWDTLLKGVLNAV
ncbi:DUF262 domain-containing protein [Pseudoalteromonas sp. DL-6]|uniref:DUF262 domain-containing protein n=1 Tax=Pseudoalteromonas sp. DL-6 TaxID=1390185 RepID=UPI00103CE393|nr:DUF262 domain-containing protein [Pseudoalteromonas sp. DL-6]QBJ62850.1 hypothetical protein B1F84_07285 [Pseudoalteromonas sp. DL-6]